MNFANNHCKIFITIRLKSHLKSRVPSYSIILTVTIISNDFNNIKKAFFSNYFNYHLLQPK